MTLLNSMKLEFMLRMLKKTEHVQGDIIEAGIYQGGALLEMAKVSEPWTRWKALYGYDTFEGLPELGTKDNREGHKRGDFTSPIEVAQETLKGRGVNLVKGYYPETSKNKLVSFAHLDMDLYEPTIRALMHLHPILHIDGIIVLDDYKWPSCPGIETAVNETKIFYEVVEENQYQIALRVK